MTPCYGATSLQKPDRSAQLSAYIHYYQIHSTRMVNSATQADAL
jgi:hypothetical protein